MLQNELEDEPCNLVTVHSITNEEESNLDDIINSANWMFDDASLNEIDDNTLDDSSLDDFEADFTPLDDPTSHSDFISG